MLRILVTFIVIAFFPLIAQAEEETKQHVEMQADEEEAVTVSIEIQFGEARITISNVKKENKEKQQKDEFPLSDSKQTACRKKRLRGRKK